MTTQKIDYERLVQDSLRGVIKSILQRVGKEGLPGGHHFYITFRTDHAEVEMPEYLREKYPEEITIVLQHEFWDLEANDQALHVTLCFNDVHERLRIPLGAVVNFIDPSVQFGLQFTPVYPEKIKTRKPRAAKGKKQDFPSDSNVIALDTFRKH